MKRLTKQVDRDDVVYVINCDDCPKLGACEDSTDCVDVLVDRLAAYEDTGLRPEAIERILDAYGHGRGFRTEIPQRLEIIKGIQTGRLRKLAQAEKEGRCVVLPCEVGDDIYMATGRWNVITGFEPDICDGFHIANDGVLQIKARCWTGNHGTYGVLGETVFLTREAAEAVLAGKEKE